MHKFFPDRMMMQGKSGEIHTVVNDSSVNPSGIPGGEVWDKILFFLCCYW